MKYTNFNLFANIANFARSVHSSSKNPAIKAGSWITEAFPLNGQLLNEEFMLKCMNVVFKNYILASVKSDFFGVMLKIHCHDGRHFSITKLQVVNKKSSIDELVEILIAYWALRSEDYHTMSIKELQVCLYAFEKSSHAKERLIPPRKPITGPGVTHKGYNLPNTTNISEWGGSIMLNDKCINIVFEDNLSILVKISDDQKSYTADLKVNKTVLFTFDDKFGAKPDTFTRVVDGKKFYRFENGKVVFKEIPSKPQFLKPLKPDKPSIPKIITMDIEAFNDHDGTFVPFACGFFDGKNTQSFYLTDFESSDDMLLALIKSVMIPKYTGFKVYFHNFSRFDGVFLVKLLAKLGKLSILYRSGNFLKITLKYDNGYYLHFFDSLLLLPSSLRKLGQSFDVNVTKSYYPYDFPSRSRLLYDGPVPSFHYFQRDLSLHDYNLKFHNQESWNLKSETLLYLNTDLISLFQIISKYTQSLISLYKVDVTKRPTVASLALTVFRTSFLHKIQSQIPLTIGSVYNNIKQAYYGGIVDTYIPFGHNLHYYDVNSLYPYSMLKDMPVGSPTFIEGDHIDLNSIFGFFYADISTPTNIHIPVLPVKLKSGITLCPKGSFSGWYFSEELKEAVKQYGYQVKVLKGYSYQRGQVFNDFVTHFYNIKSHSNGAEKNIAKLMLNSLYGKFGMSPIMEEVKIVSNDEAKLLYLNSQISERIDLDNGFEMLKFAQNDNLETDKKLNISVGLSAAIAAYSRIEINKYKHIQGNECYYSDTDSVILKHPLPSSMVGTQIGQMKLEYAGLKEGIFLAPKVYALKLANGQEITKVKGLNTLITFDQMKSLLNYHTKLSLKRVIWKRDIAKGSVQLINSIYTLMVTSNKRRVVYVDGIYNGTFPIHINNNDPNVLLLLKPHPKDYFLSPLLQRYWFCYLKTPTS